MTEVLFSDGDILTLQNLLRECYGTEPTQEEVERWAEEKLRFAHRLLLWKLQIERKERSRT